MMRREIQKVQKRKEGLHYPAQESLSRGAGDEPPPLLGLFFSSTFSWPAVIVFYSLACRFSPASVSFPASLFSATIPGTETFEKPAWERWAGGEGRVVRLFLTGVVIRMRAS